MNYKFDHKITFMLNEPFDVNFIINTWKKHPGKKFLVEVQNTKGISASQLRQLAYLKDFVKLRIAGGYDEEKVNHKKNVTYKRKKNGVQETGEYYTTAVIYDISEAITILETIEDIEKRIQKNWSDLEKVVYIYNKLKTSIMYDSKYEEKLSKEIRSLRGLITKETVCAGFALIFKEFMDRQGITCEYVEGRSGRGGHAWNIVTIGGKKYGIDLTWDNTAFLAGKKNTFDYFGKGIQDFAKSHIPDSWEKTQNYLKTLTTFDDNIIKKIHSFLVREETYDRMKYVAIRSDGTKFIIAQVGDATINGVNYYRYYYQELTSSGGKTNPLILYSQSNLARFINGKKFGRVTPNNYIEAFKNVLFSKENIARSIRSGTLYLGKCSKNSSVERFEAVKHVDEIIKPAEITRIFPDKTKVFTRSDGSVFIVEKMPGGNVNIYNQTIMCFHIFEYLKEGNTYKVKRNIVFSEVDFFYDSRRGIADDYLSRSRLDRKLNETGGYIGYYSRDGYRTYDPKIADYFRTPRYGNVKPQGANTTGSTYRR